MWTHRSHWKSSESGAIPVIVRACDARGKVLTGEPVSGRAEILDAAGTERRADLSSRSTGSPGGSPWRHATWQRADRPVDQSCDPA